MWSICYEDSTHASSQQMSLQTIQCIFVFTLPFIGENSCEVLKPLFPFLKKWPCKEANWFINDYNSGLIEYLRVWVVILHGILEEIIPPLLEKQYSSPGVSYHISPVKNYYWIFFFFFFQANPRSSLGLCFLFVGWFVLFFNKMEITIVLDDL